MASNRQLFYCCLLTAFQTFLAQGPFSIIYFCQQKIVKVISYDDDSHGGSCEEWDQAVEQLEGAETPPVSKVSRLRRRQAVCRATLRPTQNVEPKVSHSGKSFLD